MIQRAMAHNRLRRNPTKVRGYPAPDVAYGGLPNTDGRGGLYGGVRWNAGIGV